jgi:inorganic pyrophosphatase
VADRIPSEVEVLIEVPRGSFVKREAGRGVEYVSPLPCPFDYGCVPDLPGADGDPLDVVLLGGRHPAGTRLRARVWAVVRFEDDGAADDKLVCGPCPPDAAELARVERFFRLYAHPRRWMNLARGRRGRTRFVGIERVPG